MSALKGLCVTLIKISRLIVIYEPADDPKSINIDKDLNIFLTSDLKTFLDSNSSKKPYFSTLLYK